MKPQAKGKRFGIEKAYARVCKGLCERISQKRRETKIYPSLEFAGVSQDFDIWLGKRMLVVILAGIIGLLMPLTLGKYFGFVEFLNPIDLLLPAGFSILLAVAFAALTAAMFYLHHYYVVEGRAAMVEEILPDFMMLVSSNVNAGMTPFSAFRASARKEFGPLSEEIRIAAAKSLGTRSFSSALKQMSVRIKSKILEETISFFSQAMKSGGKLTKLLETGAMDLRQTQEMKKELQSSTKMYVIFVAFVIVIATPLLLAVSIQFLNMITAIQGESAVDVSGDVGGVAFLSSEMNIKPDFMQNMSYLLLFGNAILASFFIGVIGQGKAKMGLKYAPIIFLASLAAMLASNAVLGQFLGI